MVQPHRARTTPDGRIIMQQQKQRQNIRICAHSGEWTHLALFLFFCRANHPGGNDRIRGALRYVCCVHGVFNTCTRMVYIHIWFAEQQVAREPGIYIYLFVSRQDPYCTPECMLVTLETHSSRHPLPKQGVIVVIRMLSEILLLSNFDGRFPAPFIALECFLKFEMHDFISDGCWGINGFHILKKLNVITLWISVYQLFSVMKIFTRKLYLQKLWNSNTFEPILNQTKSSQTDEMSPIATKYKINHPIRWKMQFIAKMYS
jgi:hypothetical protein